MRPNAKCGRNGANMAHVRSAAQMGRNSGAECAKVKLESAKESAKKITIVSPDLVQRGRNGKNGRLAQKPAEVAAT